MLELYRIVGVKKLLFGFFLVVSSSILEIATYSIIISILFKAVGSNDVSLPDFLTGHIYFVSTMLVVFYCILLILKLLTAKLSFGLANSLVFATSNYYMQYPSRLNRSDFTAMSTSDSNYLIVNAILPIFMFLSEFFILILIFSYLLHGHTKLMLLFVFFLVCAVLIYLPIAKFVLPKLAQSRKILESNRISYVNEIGDLIEYASHPSVRVFLQTRLSTAQDKILSTGSYEYLLQVVPKYIIEIVIFAFVSIAIFFLKLDVDMFFLASLLRALPSLTRMVTTMQSIKISIPILKNYANTLTTIDDTKKINFPPIKRSLSIQASYSIEETDNKIFALDIAFGELIVVKGASGVGKSTFLRNLSKRDQSASVNQDGTIISLDATNLRIAYVPQEVNLINGTVRDNIALGREISDKLAYTMLSELGLLKILGNQNPLNVKIGPMFQNLSVGQRQRLGLIRALICKSDLLLLDEFTSALDPTFEKKSIDLLQKHADDRAIIAVMHRSSLDNLANKILEMC